MRANRRGAISALRPSDPTSCPHGMNTAIFLPDDVFRRAERQARRTKKSRSQLYADALTEYLTRHAPDEVTEAMDRVLDQLEQPADPFVSVAARRMLKRGEHP